MPRALGGFYTYLLIWLIPIAIYFASIIIVCILKSFIDDCFSYRNKDNYLIYNFIKQPQKNYFSYLNEFLLIKGGVSPETFLINILRLVYKELYLLSTHLFPY